MEKKIGGEISSAFEGKRGRDSSSLLRGPTTRKGYLDALIKETESFCERWFSVAVTTKTLKTPDFLRVHLEEAP